MHCLAHHIVAAEGEGDVADAAAHLAARQRGLDLAGRFDEGDGVVVVLVDAGGDGENVRIEDDVRRVEANFVDENAVRARRDCHFALDRISLALFVEGHDYHCGAVTLDQAGLLAKLVFSFFQ